MSVPKTYTRDEVWTATLNYFNGDELATNVFVTKYALRDKESNFYELTPEDMHWRLAKEFARIERKFANRAFLEPEKYQYRNPLSEEEIFSYLDKFRQIVPQGSPMYGIGNNFSKISLSNCVVVDAPTDTMSGILDTGKKLANLFKRRCGVGNDLSTLRPENASVSNSAGSSSGAWSFADFYSYITRMVGQENRRGALMLTMDVKHPDIFQFVTMKQDLKKVTGANVSVRISDEFMECVEQDADFTLQFPVDSETPTITKVIKAKELWDLIVTSATKTAEPGLIFWDTALNNLPAEEYKAFGFKTVSCNPCSELMLSANDSCRLISLLLKYFVRNPFTENAYFDFEEFCKVVRVAMRLSDDLVELELEKIERLIEIVDDPSEKELWETMWKTCSTGRRTGLGTHGLGDMLARMCLPFDSDEALDVISKVYETLRDEAYRESTYLADERGSFQVWDWELEKDNIFIQRLPKPLLERMQTTGRRNISLLTNAPTGSVSICSQSSSGIEPVFRNSYIRRRKLSSTDAKNDQVVDFVDDMGDKWQEFTVFHHNVTEWSEITGGSIENLPHYFVTSDQIDWQKRVDAQSRLQLSIDHSVSSTINLPKGTDPSVVSDIYFRSWKKGLKGVTVYVDGSRDGVLLTNKQDKKCDFNYSMPPKRPQILPCDIHFTSVKGSPWVVLVGIHDGKPYEVFGGEWAEVDDEIKKSFKVGEVEKVSFKTKNRYNLLLPNGDKITSIQSAFNNPNFEVHTRMISMLLRHGSKPHHVAEQLMKDRDSDIFSFSKVVSRVLKKYTTNGCSSSNRCSNCEQKSLVYQDGCLICMSCGHSKCG